MTAPEIDVAHVIQLAVAPVFLLTGVGALLGVMTSRLGRVIDRARHVEAAWPTFSVAAKAKARDELTLLARRAKLANAAINACTIAALLVCLVIAALFVDALLRSQHLRWLVATLFIVTMAILIVGLVLFLREVRLATRHVEIRPPD